MCCLGDCSSNKSVIVREVWAANLKAELALIEQVVDDYPFASMDTEFPGTIFIPVDVDKRRYCHLPPSDNYRLMRANVNALKIIQIGLTLSDDQGNLPDFKTQYSYIWQFNFRDFDIRTDHYNCDSIALLRKQGMDFEKNREEGIDSREFATMLLRSKLVFNWPATMTWVTFHGGYDFGFLMKILTQTELPQDLYMFMGMVSVYLGETIYDVKHMMKYCKGLYGGLERVAETLHVHRVAGKSHQAGSDCLLTMHTFLKLRDIYFNGKMKEELDGLYGLGNCCYKATY